jgi:uncharacterized membrane protein YphA (DoxX/SURF4 family)
MSLAKHSALVLRLGLAFVFGWFGIDKFLYVDNWLGWIPSWMTFVPPHPFLYALGVLEIVAALFLLGGKYLRVVSLACAALMAGIVFSFGINDITVRDIGLIAMALALAMMPENRKYHELDQLHKAIKHKR